MAPANARTKKTDTHDAMSFTILPQAPPKQIHMTLCMIDTRVRTQLLTEWEHAHDEIPSRTPIVQMWRVRAGVCAHSRMLVRV